MKEGGEGKEERMREGRVGGGVRGVGERDKEEGREREWRRVTGSGEDEGEGWIQMMRERSGLRG